MDVISSAGTCFREERRKGDGVQLYRGIIREVSKQKQIFKALCLERRGQVVWQIKETQQLKTFYVFFKMEVVEQVLYYSVFLDNTLASLGRFEQKRWRKIP